MPDDIKIKAMQDYFFEVYVSRPKKDTKRINNLHIAEAISIYETLKAFAKNNTIIDLVDQQTGEIFASTDPDFY